MNKAFSFLFLFCFLSSAYVNAQLFDRLTDGAPIRSYVKRLGPMQDRPLQDMIDSFRRQQYDEIKMTYAIYYWVAQNIRFDPKAFHHRNRSTVNASAALRTRKTTSEGYAAVFQTLCDVAGIKCYTIKGWVKAHPEDIGVTNDRTEHDWNVVMIKNLLLLIDPTLAAGHTDYKRKSFEQEYADGWFFTTKDFFFLNHFSKDKKSPIPSELLPDKLSFNTTPVVYDAAIVMNLLPSATTRGKLRGTKGKTKTIDIEMRNRDLNIFRIAVLENGRETEISLKTYENILVVDIPLNEAGEYPMILKINNKNVFGFMANVSDRKK